MENILPALKSLLQPQGWHWIQGSASVFWTSVLSLSPIICLKWLMSEISCLSSEAESGDDLDSWS